MIRRIGGYVGAKPTWTTVSTSGVFSLRDVKKLKADAQWPRGPEAPTDLSVTVGSGEVVLAWSPPAVTHGQIAGYVVEYSAAGGQTFLAYGGGPEASRTFVGLTNGTQYTFRVAGVNHTRGDWSLPITATPAATPVITITSQPSNQTASAGAATFSVAATVTENATLSYQWEKQDGGAGAFAAVSGATSASFVLSGLTNGNDNGDVYRCVVSATGGAQSVTSNSATLTVPVEYPQFINVSGHTGAGDVNGSYLLEATLTNGRPSYQRGAGTRIYWNGWPDYWAIVGLVNGSSVLVRSNGANAALPPTSGWSANHGGGTLAVDFPSVGISQQPTPQTTTNGAASFTVAALSSTVSPTYQWQRQESGVGEFSNISGATGATLSLSGLTYSADNGDVYRCVVSESSNGTSATSNAASLTVLPQFIYVSGHSGAGNLNGTYELEATLTADRPAYRRDASTRVYYLSWPGYWRFDNSGSRVATHSTSPVLPPTGGWVLDMGSGTLAVSYTPPTPVITITSQPTNQTASGGAATFSVSATVTENATLSYQWQKQESGAGAFSAVSGATSSSLALSGLTNADDNGDVYRCVVSATGGAQSVTSSGATLTVPAPSGQPTPVLLATFDGDVLLDLGPNNYWLESALGGYSDNGSVADAYAITNWYEESAYISNNAAQVGPNYGSNFSLGIRTQVGRANFLSQISDGPFTIEMQYYPGGDLSTLQYSDEERYFKIGPYLVAGIKANSYYSQNYGLPAYAHTAVYGDYIDSSTELCHTPVVLTPQSWNHIALVVDSNTVRLYINGSLACSGSTYPGSFSEFRVGGLSYAPFMSQVDNLRVVDSAIYTGNDITVPTSASLTYTRTTNPTTELLLNATHGIEDWGKNRIRLEHGPYWSAPGRSAYSPIVSTDQYKYGGASYYMDGTVSGLYPIDATYWNGQTAAIASLTSTLQNGPWTIEMWVRPTATLSYNSTPTGDPEQSGEAYWTLGFGPNNYIALYDNIYSGPIYDAENSTWLPPDAISTGVTLDYRVGGVSQRVNLPTSLSRNAWHHLAVVADTANGLLRLKVNGAEVGTIDISGSWSSKGAGWPGTDGLVIGELNNVLAGGGQYYGNTYNWFTGYIDDIRISSVALYGTGSYSVPTAALT